MKLPYIPAAPAENRAGSLHENAYINLRDIRRPVNGQQIPPSIASTPYNRYANPRLPRSVPGRSPSSREVLNLLLCSCPVAKSHWAAPCVRTRRGCARPRVRVQVRLLGLHTDTYAPGPPINFIHLTFDRLHSGRVNPLHEGVLAGRSRRPRHRSQSRDRARNGPNARRGRGTEGVLRRSSEAAGRRVD